MRVFSCGDLIQRISVADLTAGGDADFAAMLDGRQAVVYSDPPWSPGNEKWWRRHAGEKPPESYDRLLDAWCRCAVAARPEHVVVEQSVKPEHKQMLLDAIARCRGWALPLAEEWVALYGSPKRPNAVLHFGHEKLTTNPSGLSGEPMTRTVFCGLRQLGALSCGMVADPCTGLGMTSRMAHEFGLAFVGTELNAARLDKTIGWLLSHGYAEDA